MQRAATNLPAVAHAANVSGRSIFVFRPEPGPEMLRGSEEMRQGVIFRLAEGQTSFQRSSGPASWAAMSLPIDGMDALSNMAGLDLTPPPEGLRQSPSLDLMAKLERLHKAAGFLAHQAPEIIANSSAARGMEHELVQALIACLRPAHEPSDQGSAYHHRHSAIMRKFRGMVENSGDNPVYISDICSTLGVSDRTLRACCQEQLGMGPIRYLWLRRMQLARRALSLASPASATVTDIATLYGFWELGRFAGSYRRLYGELPSATLQHPPDLPVRHPHRAA
jgi:AraC-like DNA-binding protein